MHTEWEANEVARMVEDCVYILTHMFTFENTHRTIYEHVLTLAYAFNNTHTQAHTFMYTHATPTHPHTHHHHYKGRKSYSNKKKKKKALMATHLQRMDTRRKKK